MPIGRRRRGTAMLTALCAVAALASALAPSSAQASGTQVAILQDGSVSGDTPTAMEELRHLGVRMVRVFARWSDLAPRPLSRRQPSFDPLDPAAYSVAAWAPLDAIVTAAEANHMSVLVDVTGGVPLWADGAHPPRNVIHNRNFAWAPSAVQFGNFVAAVATRYSGSYTACGACTALPAVHNWEIYNEENFGPDLAPQAVDGSKLLVGAAIYRGLLGAAWRALASTGHGQDSILMGGLGAYGTLAGVNRGHPLGLPGAFGMTPPLAFLRALYCVNGRYQPNLGRSGRQLGCPTTRAGSRRFRAQNPALFDLSGVAVHPYPLASDSGLPPVKTSPGNPDWASFPRLSKLAAVLDRTQRAYGSSARLPIWSTEYGYITNPPNHTAPFPSPANQAYYLNWAEYLSWRNPRIQSFMQYLLADPDPTLIRKDYGGFASGLEFFGGRPKPSYAAWRLPLYLPNTVQRQGGSLEVWGCVRPAYFAELDTGQPQSAELQFLPTGSNVWVTVKTISLSGPDCYFDESVALPSSGSLRLSYAYPAGDVSLTPTTVLDRYIDPIAPAVSRTVQIKLK